MTRERAIALLASNRDATFQAIERAEDERDQSAADPINTAAGTNDVVIVLAATGTTP